MVFAGAQQRFGMTTGCITDERAAIQTAIENIHAAARGAEAQLFEVFESGNMVAQTLATLAVSRVAIMLEQIRDTMKYDAH